jgi:hypothetical protein
MKTKIISQKTVEEYIKKIEARKKTIIDSYPEESDSESPSEWFTVSMNQLDFCINQAKLILQ